MFVTFAELMVCFDEVSQLLHSTAQLVCCLVSYLPVGSYVRSKFCLTSLPARSTVAIKIMALFSNFFFFVEQITF